MDPPQCVQNAMMTKDKKPFTYTPGGIDLSEVRSPRMARRIERNAHLPGSTGAPPPTPHPPQDLDRLPASALAAMRPQPQVQVFPSPPPAQPFRGAGAPPPPPPPMGMGIPPPPPPPAAPLPTQKVRTGDNQVLERPDMTKIIPDNPMTLLRRTGGPQPRKSLVDEIFAQTGKPAPQTTPPIRSPTRYQPNGNGGGMPASPVPQQPQSPIYKPQPEQQYQPKKFQQPQSPNYPEQRYPQQYQAQSQQYQSQPQQYQPQPQTYEPVRQQQSPPEVLKEQPRYQSPTMERQLPKPSTAYHDPLPEVKTSTAHLGSLYIPPVEQQKRIVSPLVPPERNQDSPKIDSPSLREAPKPWQIKKAQQEETPAWAKKENQTTPPQATREQQTWPQSRPTRQNQPDQLQQQQQQQQPIGVRIEIRTKPTPPYEDFPNTEERKPEAVYVTQPVVLQHPGPRAMPQQEQQQRVERRVEQRGERIIPIQIEGSSQASPGAERSLQRQQSNPTQSNKFKIIQKFTNTDEDETQPSPITEHSPKYPQNFQQQQDINFQEEENFRYRGGHIPSRIFKFIDDSVSRGPQNNNNNGPYIRSVPIKMEGNEQPQQYVHPSQQVVPEPKKYTGSSIPGRSFRILQAMTAPDNNCANVTDQTEAFQYDEWEYNRPCLPYPPYPPYWPYPYPYPSSESESTPRNTPTLRDIPVPYWGYSDSYPPSETESDSKSTPNTRNTPTPKPAYPPYWGYPPPPRCSNPEAKEDYSSLSNTPTPWAYGYHDFNYYDPYYYYYYYGYPPMYPPYPYYGPEEENPVDQSEGFRREADTENDTPTREIIEIDEAAEEPQSKSTIDDDNEEKESDDDLTNDASDEEEDGSLDDDMDNPHQLSVILEESERTESRLRSVSVMSNSTTIADSEDENDFHEVTTSSPLKLCVTISEEPSKQVVVEGSNIRTFDDTEIHASYTLRSPSITPKKCSPCRFDEDNEQVEEDLTEEELKQEVDTIVSDEGKESDESEDWWGILGDEDDMPVRKTNIPMCVPEIESEVTTVVPNLMENAKIDEADHDDPEQCITSDEEVVVTVNTMESTGVEEDMITSEDHSKQETCDDHLRKSREYISDDEEECVELNTMESSEVEEETSSEDHGDQKNSENYLRKSKNIYESVEDDEQFSGRKLMHVDDFASQFAQIRDNFGMWNLKVNPKLKTSRKQPEADSISKKNIESSRPSDLGDKVPSKVDEITKRTETISKCSADYTEYNFSKSNTTGDTKPSQRSIYTPVEIDSDSSSDDLGSSSDDNEDEQDTGIEHPDNKTEEEVKIPSIKERIQALKDSIEEKQRKIQENKLEIHVQDGRSKSRSKTTSTKSSIKSLEEFSEEEEIDSGVTSDMSRHISDSEEFPELKRLTRYQRAATHSRLFKLLQEECDTEDELERNYLSEQISRRNNLTLQLRDSCNVKERQVTNRLIDETVQSFLKHKKAQVFRNMAEEKLHAAAAKVLEEEMELLETPSTDCSSFLSPQRNSTGYSTTVPTPQEFNEEYKQYYESWNNADVTASSDDYVGYWGNIKNGVVAGSLAKCPRITSPQNIHKKMIKLLERPPTPPSRTKSNDVTNTS